MEIESLRVNARKSDLDVERMGLVWIPSRVDSTGSVELLASLGEAFEE